MLNAPAIAPYPSCDTDRHKTSLRTVVVASCIISAIRSLNADLEYSEQTNHGCRKSRKLRRKIAICSAYLELVNVCIPIIQQYHAESLFVVNRFWMGHLTCEAIANEKMPSVPEFFAWYTHSENLYI